MGKHPLSLGSHHLAAAMLGVPFHRHRLLLKDCAVVLCQYRYQVVLPRRQVFTGDLQVPGRLIQRILQVALPHNFWRRVVELGEVGKGLVFQLVHVVRETSEVVCGRLVCQGAADGGAHKPVAKVDNHLARVLLCLEQLGQLVDGGGRVFGGMLGGLVGGLDGMDGDHGGVPGRVDVIGGKGEVANRAIDVVAVGGQLGKGAVDPLVNEWWRQEVCV